MRYTAVIAAVLPTLPGCMPGGYDTAVLNDKAYAAMQASGYEECFAYETQAVEIGARQLKDAKSGAVSGDALLAQALAHQYRADCAKAAGHAAAEVEADYAKGLEIAAKALTYYEGLTHDTGLMPTMGGRIHSARIKAKCLNGLGRRLEAIAAMEGHISLLLANCQGVKALCPQAADATETLAKWKKEPLQP